jgi:hypothetical protein
MTTSLRSQSGRAFVEPKTGCIIPSMGMSRVPRRDDPRKPMPGLADALFAKVQRRVLGVLFGNAGRSFYANELIALARSGTGAVQRELRRLEASGLVTVTRVGNQKHYQANPGSPVFEELRAHADCSSGRPADPCPIGSPTAAWGGNPPRGLGGRCGRPLRGEPGPDQPTRRPAKTRTRRDRAGWARDRGATRAFALTGSRCRAVTRNADRGARGPTATAVAARGGTAPQTAPPPGPHRAGSSGR